MEKISLTCIYKTHTMYQIQTHTKFNETESCILSQAHLLVESRINDFPVIGGFRLNAHTLVLLLLLELNSPCLPRRQLFLGWQRLICLKTVKNGWGKWGISSTSINSVHIHCRIFPNEFNVF